MNNHQSGFIEDETAIALDLSADYVSDIAISRTVCRLPPDSETGERAEADSGEPVLLSNNGNGLFQSYRQ